MNKFEVEKEGSPYKPFLNVCDTELYSPRDGFAAFREVVGRAFMPWILERESESEFRGRIVSFSGEFGSFARTSVSQLTALRNAAEISKSPDRCLYANYVISGKLVIEQNGIVTTAEKGDLVIYDSTLPVKHRKLGEGLCEDVAFSISKHRLGMQDTIFNNVVVPKTKIIAPLTSCFSFLSQNISTALPEELDAIGAACAALLTAAAGSSAGDQGSEASKILAGHYAR